MYDKAVRLNRGWLGRYVIPSAANRSLVVSKVWLAIDPRALRPSELCRLLNSTPLGEVINERQLHRHRTRASLKIGDARHVDLLRYVAWLVELRHTPKPEPDGDPYEKLKDRARARNAAIALAGRDIGELPAVVNPERKARAAADFRSFCDSYFPLTFHLPWSPDHLKVIAKIEQAVLRGGLFAMAMPRGSGKTTICECAWIWAVLNGHREFVCLIGSDEGHADGHARKHQDGTRRQRIVARGLSGGRLPDPGLGWDRQPLQRTTLQGRVNAHRLDRS